MAVQDLWGELPVTETAQTPVTILREQAALLEKKTENVLQENINISAHDSKFRARFDIIAPSLDDYSYRVLSIGYPVFMYPLQIFEEVTGAVARVRECRDEESFVQALGEILSHPRIKRVVTSLLVQSREDN